MLQLCSWDFFPFTSVNIFPCILKLCYLNRYTFMTKNLTDESDILSLWKVSLCSVNCLCLKVYFIWYEYSYFSFLSFPVYMVYMFLSTYFQFIVFRYKVPLYIPERIWYCLYLSCVEFIKLQLWACVFYQILDSFAHCFLK